MSATSTPGTAPKSMSSRLLTMKFMQRAANTSPSSNTSSPPDTPSSKRRRTGLDGSPSQRNVQSLADKAAVQAAVAQEEAKRQAALDKQIAESGDTRWVLSFEDRQHSASPALSLRIVQTGFANLDASPSRMRIEEDNPEDKPLMVGRRSFGRFNKTLEKQQNPAYEDSEESTSDSDKDSEDESDDEDEDSGDPMAQLIKAGRQEAAEHAKAERRVKKRAAKEDLEKLAKKRRKQEVNLNSDVNLKGLTSLSGRQEPQRAPSIQCYRCGGPHLQKDCTQVKRGFPGGDDRSSKKSRRSY